MFTFGSLCSGVGMIDLGLERTGMECRWQVEVDGACRNVLERHYPGVPRVGDVRDAGAHNLTPTDLICFGFPCQDLSVAGGRAGLDGERSAIFYECHRVLTELRPRWIVVENVDNLLRSTGGRDFQIVLGGLTGVVPALPPGGWASAGFAAGWFYKVAWRVFDAQYFGVPQRRARVVIVGHLGDGRAAEVLFESESRGWRPAPRRQKRGRVAATLTAGSHGDSNAPGRRQEDDYNLVAGSVTARYGKGADSTVSDPLVFAVQDATIPHKDMNGLGISADGPMYTLDTRGAHGDAVRSGAAAFDDEGLPAPTMAVAFRNKGDSQDIFETLRAASHGALPMVAHTLTSEGADASEDGTGRGVPLGSVAPHAEQGDPCIAFNHADGGNDASEGISPTLRARNSVGSSQTGSGGMSDAHPAWGVRRLTPLECERLQGLPDLWTKYDAHGREQSDAKRYKQIGNGAAVPVFAWVGRRIVAAESGVEKVAP